MRGAPGVVLEDEQHLEAAPGADATSRDSRVGRSETVSLPSAAFTCCFQFRVSICEEVFTMFRIFQVRPHERGLLFKDGAFTAILGPGRHVRWDVLRRLTLEVVSVRDVFLAHKDLDVIVRSGKLGAEAVVVDLADDERALVWVEKRFSGVIGPGLHALWTVFHDVRVERLSVTSAGARFQHEAQEAILGSPSALRWLDVTTVESGTAGVVFRDGRAVETLPPGRYAFWKGTGKTVVRAVDLRESAIDIAGQELMTSDKVTLRLNALVVVKAVDALRTLTAVEDARQALYRDAQLALRVVVGSRELDQLLADKDAAAEEALGMVRARATALGFEALRFGVRDVILPGDMKELLNKVTEARKAAEASLVTRREETAAMRSQLNTAKLIESSPTLMRLRELEVLEKVAQKANLTVVLGEQGLTDRVVKKLI